ncbi:MAG: valine--tRNA ligase [Patescibacteria group bacterium]|nr:valine--tRNA ligase [Patescibacteria group bacterium]
MNKTENNENDKSTESQFLFGAGAYDPKPIEPKIYELWEKSGFFNPDNLPGKKTYVVYMPLPNVTGTLHIGHALDNTLPDILIRYYRMKGIKTLWLPGTDHAGIATQYVVEKELKKKGISKFELGREKFVEKIWEWKKEYGNLILEQLKKLGVSADWSRNRFTMDETYAKDVKKAFVHYYKKGWLYQGLRTVNWCPRCGTSLSELELEYKDEETKLWYIKYPSKDSGVVIATTRPETMLGDTAIAVNPKDERFKKLVGKTVTLPIVNREILIIEDEVIDEEFGTGAVKVTPAHDIADFEISERHKLPIIQVIDERGRMTKEAGEYKGLKTIEAREKIIEELIKLNLLIKTERYSHRITICYRCGSIIEPIPSKQWFLKMNELAKKAIKAVRKGKIKIIPKNFEAPYFAWLQTIRDWTVSRQIWWGHQLPAWFCKNNSGKFEVGENKPKKCPFCNQCEMEQSPDVLDTWFSSALWPFAGLSEKDLKNYYPGDLVMNAREILNLWDARMIYSGLEFKKEIPFKNVLIHGTILTKDGKRMSKSLGTGIDPLKYIEQYGADATRFAVIWQANGQDIHWNEAAVVAGRKFTNKIWNAARFVVEKTKNVKINNNNPKVKSEADKKILESLSKIKKDIERNIENFEFSKALHELYDFFWHEFCDIYIETSKKQFENNKEITIETLDYVLKESLKILHPFMPFITEQIYQTFKTKNKQLLLIESW